ncbi:hypothetical protein [Acaryochloris sp. CCMEE 5410]|uniref:hypothetical protein n=1 Tax=Acaryochloris sp. CCMEE 5410 TaxID=310037 RepID=UPI0002485227|nr:hypothetical protein [Acaryochloris sp. CCMEE 5410]
MILYLLAQASQSGVPFPTSPNPTSTNPIDQETAKVGIEVAKQQGEAIAQGLDGLWDILITPNSPLYSALIKGLAPIVALGFLFWGSIWARDMNQQGLSMESLQKLIWPLIVIVLLNNNGEFLALATRGSAFIPRELSKKVLTASYGNVTGIEAIQKKNLDQAKRRAIQERVSVCVNQEPKDVEQCTIDATKKVEAETRANERETQFEEEVLEIENGQSKVVRRKPKPVTRGGKKDNFGVFGKAFNDALRGVFIFIMAAFNTAFAWFYNFAMIVWATTGPLWISITLLPFKTRGVVIFFSGIMGLGMTNVTYSVLNVASALALASAQHPNDLFYPIITGLLNPLLAFVIGAGSAIGVFVGTGTAVAWLLKGGRLN